MAAWHGRSVKIRMMIGSVALLLCAGGYFFIKRNEIPEITLPVSPEPNPNARRFFLAASEQMQDGKTVTEAMAKRTLEIFRLPPPSNKVINLASKTHVYTLAEKTALVRRNQKALATLREGFACEYGNRPLRSPSDTDAFLELGKFRELANLLALEAAVKRAAGDYSGAVSSQMDAMEMGVMVPRNGVMVALLHGASCETTGRMRIWDDYPHLNAAQSTLALRRLVKIEARRFPFADVMEEERRFGQAALLEHFHSAEGVPDNPYAETNAEGESTQSPAKKWAWKMRVYWIGRRTILDNHTRYMEQWIRDLRQPYGLHLPPPPLPHDPVNAELMPVFSNSRIKQVTAETQNRLLAVCLALQIIQKSRGAYPPSLDAVRAMLPADLLTDPFAATGELRYRRDGSKFILYSVGPDGKDDGGKPIYDKTKSDRNKERARYNVEVGSIGDVVAGVNR